MKRLFKTEEDAGQGGVYRNLDTDNSCINSGTVPTLPLPTCEIYPSTSERIGSLPDDYGTSAESDPVSWVSAWDDIYLGNFVLDPTYPNLWNRLTTNPNPGAPFPAPDATAALMSHRDYLLSEYGEDCFCEGDGISFIWLRLGAPKFPAVETLPFFWLPAVEEQEFVAPIQSVRPNNPDGPPVSPCEDSEGPGINMVIEDGQLKVQYNPKKDQVFKARKQEEDTAHQMTAGYPIWCCKEDECNPGTFVMRQLNFPNWPQLDVRDPGTCGEGEEPLGYIPFVTDVGCTSTGELAVYYGGLVIHNGRISDIKWDTAPPREDTEQAEIDEAPTNPEDLSVNTDYQGEELVSLGTPGDGECPSSGCC
jgi:hypothetical protein